MHLGDGGGCDRRPELHEVILELAAEGLLDRLARFRLREWRQPVLQVCQVPCELWADHVGARCKELSELDVAGAEACQGGGDARLRRLTGMKGRCNHADRQRGEAGEAQPQGHGDALGHEPDTMLGKDSTGPRKAQAVG